MFRTLLWFSLAGALLGEGAEMLRLGGASGTLVAWNVRLLLFAWYGAVAMAAFVVARALRLGLATATFLYLAALLVPWLNVDYLPGILSPVSIAGTLAALAACAGVAAVIGRRPRFALAVAVLTAAAGNGLGSFSRSAPGRAPALGVRPPWNVMIVVLDTLRADHLGAYGYSRPTSPHFDRLAAEGLLFENANSQAGWTKPSVATLLTGTYPHRHGVMSEYHALGGSPATLGELLSAVGYRTVAFSSNPWVTPQFRFDRGFEEFFQSVRASGVQLTLLFRVASRVEALVRRAGAGVELTGMVRSLVEAYPTNRERDTRLLAELRRWLRAHRDERFFAYVHLIGPHSPYDPPEQYAAPFRPAAWKGGPPPVDPPTRARSIFEKAPPVDALTREMFIAQYDGAIAFTDHLLGSIREELEALDLLDQTLLIVTSDHGEEFYEHGSWRHWHALYNEVIHVPLVFRLPGVVPEGRRQDRAMLVDVAPTVAALAGLDSRADFDGRNLLAGEAGEGPAFAEYWEFHGAGYESYAALHGRWKMIRTRDGRRGRERTEVYDLENDPGEQRNLLEASQPAADVPVTELRAALDSFGRRDGRSAPEVVLNEETRERMRRLGY